MNSLQILSAQKIEAKITKVKVLEGTTFVKHINIIDDNNNIFEISIYSNRRESLQEILIEDEQENTN